MSQGVVCTSGPNADCNVGCGVEQGIFSQPGKVVETV